MPRTQSTREVLDAIEPINWFRLERNSLGQVEMVNDRHPEWERPLITNVVEVCSSERDGESVTIYRGKFYDRDDTSEVFIGDLVFSTEKFGGNERFGRIMKLVSPRAHYGAIELYVTSSRSAQLAFLDY